MHAALTGAALMDAALIDAELTQIETAGPTTARLMPAARSIAKRVFWRLHDEEGAATAEYAVATMAAVGFAGLLIVILRGDEVRGMLTDLVRDALTVG